MTREKQFFKKILTQNGHLEGLPEGQTIEDLQEPDEEPLPLHSGIINKPDPDNEFCITEESLVENILKRNYQDRFDAEQPLLPTGIIAKSPVTEEE
jgi:hypothetical protein